MPNINLSSHHPIPLSNIEPTHHHLKQDKSVPNSISQYSTTTITPQNRSISTTNLSTSIARLSLTGDPGAAGRTVVVSGHCYRFGGQVLGYLGGYLVSGLVLYGMALGVKDLPGL